MYTFLVDVLVSQGDTLVLGEDKLDRGLLCADAGGQDVHERGYAITNVSNSRRRHHPREYAEKPRRRLDPCLGHDGCHRNEGGTWHVFNGHVDQSPTQLSLSIQH